MTLRVKSDKEYAALLLSITQQTEKQEAVDYVSTVSKVSCLPVGGGLLGVLVLLWLRLSVVVSGDPSD